MERIDYVSRLRMPGDDDDTAIRRCMDAAAEGTHTVVLDEKEYCITRAVCIPSDTTVVLDGCHVIQQDGTVDNAFRGANLVCDPEDPLGMPLSCAPLHNVRLLGKNGACVSGPAVNRSGYHPVLQAEQLMVGDFWGWRTFTVSLSNCTDFEVAGIRFDRSRCWTLSFDRCCDGHIHDLDIHTAVKNGDGVDLRAGCRRITVENITGVTSDDTVACTALYGTKAVTYPLGNYLYPLEPSQCLERVTEEDTSISHVTVRNIVSGGNCHGVICLAADGSRVHHVTVEHVRECGSGCWREATVKIYTGYGGQAVQGDIHDITIRCVESTYADYGVYCNTPVAGGYIEGVTAAHTPVRLDFPEGFTVK